MNASIYTPIQALHRTRARQIYDVIQPTAHDPADTPIIWHPATGYCLAHHVLEGAETAARTRDISTFDWYRTHPDANGTALATPSDAGPRIVVAPDLGSMPRSAISETPYYVLGPDTPPAPPELREMARAACDLAVKSSFHELVAAHAVVICLLRRKKLGDTLDSWTITRLPGTIFCDHVGDPVVLARDLIHEAGHNWLNDTLAATSSKISSEYQFYSPWKRTTRPAFGFLHACWAFPLTMIYTARVLPHTNAEPRRFLAAYLKLHRGLLADTADDHARALSLVSDHDLRSRLHSVHHEALHL